MTAKIKAAFHPFLGVYRCSTRNRLAGQCRTLSQLGPAIRQSNDPIKSWRFLFIFLNQLDFFRIFRSHNDHLSDRLIRNYWRKSGPKRRVRRFGQWSDGVAESVAGSEFFWQPAVPPGVGWWRGGRSAGTRSSQIVVAPDEKLVTRLGSSSSDRALAIEPGRGRVPAITNRAGR